MSSHHISSKGNNRLVRGLEKVERFDLETWVICYGGEGRGSGTVRSKMTHKGTYTVEIHLSTS